MEKSKIYDLLEDGLLSEWRDEIEETEKDSWYFTREKKALEELEVKLDEQGKDLLKSYFVSLEGKLDYIHYNLEIKILNLGIKIGMELNESFAEQKE